MREQQEGEEYASQEERERERERERDIGEGKRNMERHVVERWGFWDRERERERCQCEEEGGREENRNAQRTKQGAPRRLRKRESMPCGLEKLSNNELSVCLC